MLTSLMTFSNLTTILVVNFGHPVLLPRAMLVNSADLMSRSSEPDGGYRGIGRVYLEGLMPVDGDGDMGVFIVDTLGSSIDQYTPEEYPGVFCMFF